MNNMCFSKRIIKYISLILISSLLLCGCNSGIKPSVTNTFDSLVSNTEREEKEISVNKEDIIVVEKVEELTAGEEAEPEELPGSDFAKAQEEIISNGSRYYAYAGLNDDEKLLYTEILGILDSFENDVKVSTIDRDLIDRVFHCVLTDHPELFYVSGYSITKYVRGQKLEKITFSGKYIMSKSEAEKAKIRIDNYTDGVISGYTKGGDEYEKVKYVYEYLILNNEYDPTAPNNQNILSIVDENRTVCQGYAKMTQYLLNKMGVFCTLIDGVVKGSEAHVWNIVQIDGKYYHVDTTWGDANYNIADDSDPTLKVPEINYDYLCITDDEIKKTHVSKETLEYPVCDSMDAYYYVKEGLYFTELNTDQVKEAFERMFTEERDGVVFKCSSPTVFAALYSFLIDDKNVFNYLHGVKNINFCEYKNDCKLAIYI